MSILEALKTLNIGKDSIKELAALPQNEIIRMAQMGRIPADILPVIISEKARITKDLANLQAQQKLQQQGGNQPTVLEQAMQANQMPPQQNEMAPPQQPAQQDAGIAGLPTGDMFAEQNFEEGGIVGGAGKEKKPGTGPASLAEMLAEYQKVKAPYSGITPERQEELDYLKRGSLSKEDIEQQRNMRLLEAGLGIMGGESPYALTNIAKGAQSALKGYSEDLATQRATKLADLRARSALAESKRAENLADVGVAQKMYDSYLDREMQRQLKEQSLENKNKSNQTEYAENYVKMRKSKGDKRPDEEILDEGFNRYYQNYGQAQQRISTQADTTAIEQETARARLLQEARAKAMASWDNMKADDQRKRRYRDLAVQDRQTGGNAAEEYRRSIVNGLADDIMGASQRPPLPSEVSVEVPPPKKSPLPPGGIAGLAPKKPDIKNIQGAPAGSVIGDYDVKKQVWPLLKWDEKTKAYKVVGYYGK